MKHGLRFRPEALRETTLSEHAARFVYGGLVAVGTGLVSAHCGPAVSGMFLAFPSIVPATLTLIKRYAGRERASDAAEGAAVGAFGLGGFAVATATFAEKLPPFATLGLALLLWGFLSVLGWLLVLATRRTR